MFDLTGRTALVTGANRGIGLAIAEGLAAAGADVVAVSSSIATEGSEVARRVTALGRRCEAVRVDFSDREAVLELGRTLAGRVDVLVNNAGTIHRAPAIEHPLDAWDRVLEIDLTSQFALTQLLAAPMLERGRGKVVFTASLLSLQGGINVPSYAAAKSAVAGLTRALANEWAPRGVNVNALVPGYIATDNTTALREDPVRAEQILTRIPAGRWGQASDLVGAAVFLASAASDYVHGTLLPVDGGWLSR
ncbi:SDR family NAD(P)-dependent oxidoreductase [Desertihabitans brevis]|uniref:SDR family NAD(P)-dependent oxidoreductase n=1 Tax=Desertihabitans brevis TaxID=2268447 RepID=A0A367YZT3_9ACTN|nr:SDR family NAD(P)-dependent oxidoreductase [Desertihabitans brevis]